MSTDRRNLASAIPGLACRATLVMLVVTFVVLAATLPRYQPVKISGWATCASGQPVVGVWVKATYGGSDYTEAPQPERSARARFLFTLPSGGPYEVHIGCGGYARHWRAESWSGQVSTRQGHFYCHDTTPLPSIGRCDAG